MYTMPLQQNSARSAKAAAKLTGAAALSPTVRNPMHLAAGGDVTRRVQLFLSAAALPGLRRIHVDVAGDTVVLSGRVRTFYERQTAVERSRRVAGVIQVDDRIEVVA